MENADVKTKEEILKNMYGLTEVAGFKLGMEGRGFKFGVDIDAEELAEDIQMLMSKGVTYDDAENIVLCKIMARFAARFQEMHATAAIAIEDYEDKSVHPFLEELNMHLVGLEADINRAADSFCGHVFGDAGESIYDAEEVEVIPERRKAVSH